MPAWRTWQLVACAARDRVTGEATRPGVDDVDYRAGRLTRRLLVRVVEPARACVSPQTPGVIDSTTAPIPVESNNLSGTELDLAAKSMESKVAYPFEDTLANTLRAAHTGYH